MPLKEHEPWICLIKGSTTPKRQRDAATMQIAHRTKETDVERRLVRIFQVMVIGILGRRPMAHMLDEMASCDRTQATVVDVQW
jgi:hypothetical protein